MFCSAPCLKRFTIPKLHPQFQNCLFSSHQYRGFFSLHFYLWSSPWWYTYIQESNYFIVAGIGRPQHFHTEIHVIFESVFVQTFIKNEFSYNFSFYITKDYSRSSEWFFYHFRIKDCYKIEKTVWKEEKSKLAGVESFCSNTGRQPEGMQVTQLLSLNDRLNRKEKIKLATRI